MWLNNDLKLKAIEATKFLNDNNLYQQFEFDGKTFCVCEIFNKGKLSDEINTTLGIFDFEEKKYLIFR